MPDKEKFNKRLQSTQRQLRVVSILAAIAAILFMVLFVNPSLFHSETEKPKPLTTSVSDDLIENGIHVKTGFIAAEGLEAVIQNCTSCHSSQLVIQNRMNADRWNATIKWMQETQNLWDLGGNQEVIVNYLVSNYPPVEKGRRANLQNVDWYELEP